MLSRVLLVCLAVLGGLGGALANGMADMTSDGRVVAWNSHYAFILVPGYPVGPQPSICIITPQTIVAGSDGLVLYNGRLVMSAWFLDSNGHDWYFNEVAGCSDRGVL